MRITTQFVFAALLGVCAQADEDGYFWNSWEKESYNRGRSHAERHLKEGRLVYIDRSVGDSYREAFRKLLEERDVELISETAFFRGDYAYFAGHNDVSVPEIKKRLGKRFLEEKRQQAIQSVPNRKMVVYVADASGSMLSEFPFVLNELKQSMNELSETQDFCILFYQDGKVIHAWRKQRTAATRNAVTAVKNWLDEGNIVPQGTSDPRKAIRKAFAYEPDLIFVLSHDLCGTGRFATDPGRVLRIIRRRHRKNAIKVHWLQFIDSHNADVFKKAAQITGGRHIQITPQELGLGPRDESASDD